MVRGGATKICFVISPGKSDILEYYGASLGPADLAYVVQPRAAGLCDAIFRALPLIAPEDGVLVGLPDTIWFPEDGFRALPDDRLAFLLFPVRRPELFDAVVTDAAGHVRQIQVKQHAPATNWIWGAFKLPGTVLHELHQLWRARDQKDNYFGTLVNAYLEQGGLAVGLRAGSAYVDVGTLNGYREALRLLGTQPAPVSPAGPAEPELHPVASAVSNRSADRESAQPAGAARTDWPGELDTGGNGPAPASAGAVSTPWLGHASTDDHRPRKGPA